MDLDGATCLVTGANRGIGLAVARELARRPVRLLVGVRDLDRAPDLGPTAAREVRTVRMDLSGKEAIEESCAQLGDDVGRIDLLINNAGRLSGGQLERQDVDAMYAMFQVNLVAVAHLTARVLPGMLARGHGKVVNNASISGFAAFPGASTYAAAKAGVVALTDSLRRELHGTGVSTLLLVTGGVETDMLEETRQAYAGSVDTSSWGSISPEAWATKVVRAIERDATVLQPDGKVRLATIAGRGPRVLLDVVSRRMFERAPAR
ncbi:MAG: uncharacterized protein QOC78_3821 [Solirubrobacteraceae bacterium]|jgi:short-subunit dehydrogenase|nr:uncharacterized protein [Solirubrobacteraceae bacterium]